MKTINRVLLLKALAAGKLLSIGSRSYDDMSGEENRKTTIPARLSKEYGDFIEGQCNLRESDFRSGSGRAWENPDGTFTLYVHSNHSVELKLKDGEPLREFSGNGGTFSVSVRGHNELLVDPQEVAA